jgi:hypothetical protein
VSVVHTSDEFDLRLPRCRGGSSYGKPFLLVGTQNDGRESEEAGYSVKETSLLNAAMSLDNYEKVGPESFELLKVLGQGGYGKVCGPSLRLM